MLTPEEANSAILLIDRADIKGSEAEATVIIKQKLKAMTRVMKNDIRQEKQETEEKGCPEKDRHEED